MRLVATYFYQCECKLHTCNIFPGLGEHSRNYGWLCTGEDVCSVCVGTHACVHVYGDKDHSSTKVYTALSNVRPRTLIFSPCAVLTRTSNPHICMCNNQQPLTQLASPPTPTQQSLTPQSKRSYARMYTHLCIFYIQDKQDYTPTFSSLATYTTT